MCQTKKQQSFTILLSLVITDYKHRLAFRLSAHGTMTTKDRVHHYRTMATQTHSTLSLCRISILTHKDETGRNTQDFHAYIIIISLHSCITRYIALIVSLVPRPLPAIQCCTRTAEWSGDVARISWTTVYIYIYNIILYYTVKPRAHVLQIVCGLLYPVTTIILSVISYLTTFLLHTNIKVIVTLESQHLVVTLTANYTLFENYSTIYGKLNMSLVVSQTAVIILVLHRLWESTHQHGDGDVCMDYSAPLCDYHRKGKGEREGGGGVGEGDLGSNNYHIYYVYSIFSLIFQST